MNSSCKGPVTRENVSIWWRHHVSLCHHINKHNRRLFEKLLDQKYLRRPFQCFVIWHQNISFSYINTYKYHTQFCSIPVNQYIYFNSPSQYLNQCRFVENWSHGKKSVKMESQNKYIRARNAFENSFCSGHKVIYSCIEPDGQTEVLSQSAQSLQFMCYLLLGNFWLVFNLSTSGTEGAKISKSTTSIHLCAANTRQFFTGHISMRPFNDKSWLF